MMMKSERERRAALHALAHLAGFTWRRVQRGVNQGFDVCHTDDVDAYGNRGEVRRAIAGPTNEPAGWNIWCEGTPACKPDGHWHDGFASPSAALDTLLRHLLKVAAKL